MTPSTKDVFESFINSMLKKTDDWKDLLNENITLKGPLAEVKGKNAFIELNIPFFNSMKSYKTTNIIESNNSIVNSAIIEVMMPSKNNITLNVCEIYEINDGLIKSLNVFFDTHEFRQNLK